MRLSRSFALLAAVGINFAVTTSILPVLTTPPALAQHARPGRIASEIDDQRMYEQMNRVANWLNQYCVWNHRFPEYGDEMNWAKEQINQLIPNPPYDTGAVRLSSGLDADPQYDQPSDSPQYEMPTPGSPESLNRVQLVFDPSLTEQQVQNWRTDPPDEWQAAPGTITAISNNQNLFVLWGAGINGMPLKDPTTNRVIMIIGRYNMLYETQE